MGAVISATDRRLGRGAGLQAGPSVSHHASEKCNRTYEIRDRPPNMYTTYTTYTLGLCGPFWGVSVDVDVLLIYTLGDCDHESRPDAGAFKRSSPASRSPDSDGGACGLGWHLRIICMAIRYIRRSRARKCSLFFMAV